MAYRPQPVLRIYIPKAGRDKMRSLGIPTLEDKLVQAGLVKILNAIYEQDFSDDSYGFRPNQNCHDALRALSQTVENKPIHYRVEADIKGFFDNVNQNQLIAFLSHRIADKRILRVIKRFLIAGIQEDGQHKASARSTPQGGVISPILANIYLHYSLDNGYEKRIKRQAKGYSRLIRYADDYVVCFENSQDASDFIQSMITRLDKFYLEIAPEKTKLFEFGKFAQLKAKSKGTKAVMFNFLGFTHYCSRSRNGRGFRMKRKTIAKLRGHYVYYGVTDNIKSVQTYLYLVSRTLFKWLNRRGI